MTATIARLILAMLLLPATGGVFFCALFALVGGSGPPRVLNLLLLWVIVYSFVAIYWILLWRKLVRWTPARIVNTALASALSLAAGLIAGVGFRVLNHQLPIQIIIFAGGGIVPIVWVLATVIVWRETPAERMMRLGRLGARGVLCPLCGYNLAGLREARCPECGATFTLDQLAAFQADQAEPLPES